jgi:AcrR family transcriptional regulator
MEEQEIKTRILNGSEELFMRYGIRSVSMDDIARHLGVSKKTIYQHFADKDDLVTDVTRTHFDRDIRLFRQLKAQSKNAIEELAKISVWIKEDLEKMNPSLLMDIQKHHPRAFRQWMQYKEKFVRESVVQNIEQGKREGYFRPEVDAGIIAVSRLLLIEAAFDEQHFPRGKFKLVDIQSQLFELFVYGMCTEKGRRLYEQYKHTLTVNPQQA